MSKKDVPKSAHKWVLDVMRILTVEFGESEATWRGNSLDDGWWNEGFVVDGESVGADSPRLVLEFQPCTLAMKSSETERARVKLARWSWILSGRYDVVVDVRGWRLIVAARQVMDAGGSPPEAETVNAGGSPREWVGAGI